jgi:hypothetical protein
MDKLLEPSLFSLITSLSCFSMMGSQDAINVFIPLLLNGLTRLFSQLPSDYPMLYARIRVFAHVSFCGRSLFYDFNTGFPSR